MFFNFYFEVICGCIVAITVIKIFSVVYSWISTLRVIAKIPGPPGNLILGNFIEITRHYQNDTLWDYGRIISKNYKKIYKVRNIIMPVVVITGPEDIESVISGINNVQKAAPYYVLRPWLGNGLLLNSDSSWHKKRKLLTKAFHYDVLKGYLESTAEESTVLVKQLKVECSKSSTNIGPIITEFALNTVCRAVMGTSLDNRDEKQVRYRNAIHEMGTVLLYCCVRPWLYTEFTFSLTKVYRRQKELVQILHNFSNDIIQRRKELTGNAKANAPNISIKDGTMLDILLNSQRSENFMTDTEIREEVDTFVFEGHDTTTSAISFALFELAHHQDIQEKVVEEIRNTLDKDDLYPSWKQLQEMDYLDRVIKETLRMYPSVPVIGREVTEDVITHSGYKIPKSTNMMISIYDLHHDPDLYPNPEHFDPDRFLPHNCQNRHPFSYLPFSAGPRNCIGQKFALIEMKMGIACILRKYKLKPISRKSEIQFPIDIVLRTKNCIKIKFESRHDSRHDPRDN